MLFSSLGSLQRSVKLRAAVRSFSQIDARITPVKNIAELSGRLVVLDFETSGFSHARGDRVLSIGAVEIDRRKITGAVFNTLVNSPAKCSKSTLQVHGLSPARLKNAPVADVIFPALYQFLSNSIIVAHNARFDIGFLLSEARILGITQPEEIKYFCTMDYFRKVYGKGLNLEKIAQLVLPPNMRTAFREGKHAADEDALVLAYIVEHLLSTNVS
eukprot:TRINITY_DN5346_c0_g1_i4.p1 TRINITY_DN5346_c0_g1~~TRINITY_DN5346_c0_g1_i4.p1  ORF type:complete len:215 (-),score=36.79 TRINITY_DN5346_c0_g1_i4:110-754(-)